MAFPPHRAYRVASNRARRDLPFQASLIVTHAERSSLGLRLALGYRR
jgi:hypothetical protein